MRFARAMLTASLAAAFALVATSAYSLEAIVVSVPEAIERARELDGKSVRIEGEAIGEALRAGNGSVWVNVLEAGTAIGVWMPEEMAARIQHWGAYKQTGDRVRVTGTLNLACDRHGGDLDIHAVSLEVVQRGAPRQERIRLFEALVGLVLLACAAMAAFVARARQRSSLGG